MGVKLLVQNLVKGIVDRHSHVEVSNFVGVTIVYGYQVCEVRRGLEIIGEEFGAVDEINIFIPCLHGHVVGGLDRIETFYVLGRGGFRIDGTRNQNDWYVGKLVTDSLVEKVMTFPQLTRAAVAVIVQNDGSRSLTASGNVLCHVLFTVCAAGEAQVDAIGIQHTGNDIGVCIAGTVHAGALGNGASVEHDGCSRTLQRSCHLGIIGQSNLQAFHSAVKRQVDYNLGPVAGQLDHLVDALGIYHQLPGFAAVNTLGSATGVNVKAVCAARGYMAGAGGDLMEHGLQYEIACIGSETKGCAGGLPGIGDYIFGERRKLGGIQSIQTIEITVILRRMRDAADLKNGSIVVEKDIAVLDGSGDVLLQGLVGDAQKCSGFQGLGRGLTLKGFGGRKGHGRLSMGLGWILARGRLTVGRRSEISILCFVARHQRDTHYQCQRQEAATLCKILHVHFYLSVKWIIYMKRHSVTYRGCFIGNRQLDCGSITKKARSADWLLSWEWFCKFAKNYLYEPHPSVYDEIEKKVLDNLDDYLNHFFVNYKRIVGQFDYSHSRERL